MKKTRWWSSLVALASQSPATTRPAAPIASCTVRAGREADTCALGYDRGRYLATWAWWDPYGSRPELRTATVERDRRIAQNGKYIGPYFDVVPVAVTPARNGWTIHYRLAPDGEVHRISADRDGRLGP